MAQAPTIGFHQSGAMHTAYPDMILDLRVEKQLPITVGDKTYRLQLLSRHATAWRTTKTSPV